jgi:2-succinyl-6-hydroxy-2,4-cyclohexadiene-1-carboxylate synthase
VEQDRRLAAKLIAGDFRQFLTDWYDQPLFESLRRHLDRFDKLIEVRMKNNPALLAKSLRHMGTGAQPSLWDRLDRIGTPVLLLTGEQDTKFTAIADEMSGLCRGTEKCIIADSGHNVHFEQPLEYIKHVNQFLQKNK